MVACRPFTRSARPITCGSAWRCIRQKRSLTTTVGAAPGDSWAGSKKRPSKGVTPRVEKYSGETRWPKTRSAFPSAWAFTATPNGTGPMKAAMPADETLLIAVPLEVRVRDGSFEGYQPARIGDSGGGAEHERIQNGEQHAAKADAQSQCGHGHQREAGVRAHTAERIARVLQAGGEARQPALVPDSFLGRGNAAETNRGAAGEPPPAACRAGGFPRSRVPDVPRSRPATPHRARAAASGPSTGPTALARVHFGPPSEGASTRPITAERRCQYEVSSASRFRPERVME